MKRKTRKVRINRIRQPYIYTVAEAAKVTGTHRNTVLQWLKRGLKVMDGQKPLYIHGSDLAAFLRHRASARGQRCRPDQFPCFKCRQPRNALGGSVDVLLVTSVKAQIKALCEECSTVMNKFSSVAKLAERLKAFDQVRLLNPHLGERLPASLNSYFLKDENP